MSDIDDTGKVTFMARYGTNKHVEAAMGHKYAARTVATRQDLSDDQIERLLNHDNDAVRNRTIINHHGRMSDDQFERALRHGPTESHALARTKNPAHIDRVLNQSITQWDPTGFNLRNRQKIQASIMRHAELGSLTPEHMEHVNKLDDPNLHSMCKNIIADVQKDKK